MKINKTDSSDKPNAEEVVLDVMRHFGFRRNYQVAEYFNVTPQTLSGWIKSGEIPLKHLIKYSSEVLNSNSENNHFTNHEDIKFDFIRSKSLNRTDDPFSSLRKTLTKNFSLIIILPIAFALIASIYVFLIARPVYTSKSKVLPISEDGNTSNSFSGFASQLGINMPLAIGGKVPWDEIYPEILKSGDLLSSMLEKNYITSKYGDKTLQEILIIEHNLSKYEELDQKNRVIGKLREMIRISKDRTSPIVNIDVMAFEPSFASQLSMDLILKSSFIQRQLKTNRVRQKRLFIEERLEQVSKEMKRMEKDLRIFRENNRNLSSSPSLQMRVQEMGREVDLQNSLYVTLKTQYEKAKIDEVGRDDMVQQIDGPTLPTRLTSPKIVLNISFSFFFGLFMSFFVVYLRRQFV